MKLEGRIWKSQSSRYWLAEVRELDLVTQGTSRRDAVAMLADAVESLAVEALAGRAPFRVQIVLAKDGRCTIGSSDDTRLIALMLRRLRGREGLSVREVAERLGSKSPNAYSQYESGRVAPSLDTLTKLVAALNPKFQTVLRVA
jgi:DNA-binding XRE family transcriptional regulator